MREFNTPFILLCAGLAAVTVLAGWLQFHPELWRAGG